jgi:hypothetical protein
MNVMRSVENMTSYKKFERLFDSSCTFISFAIGISRFAMPTLDSLLRDASLNLPWSELP